MLGDGGEIGGVVFGGHGYGAEEETGEGGVLVEDLATLGVDVEEVEWGRGSAGFFCEAGFDAAEEELEDGSFEGMEEKGEGGGAGEIEGEGVLLVEADGGEGRGGVSAAWVASQWSRLSWAVSARVGLSSMPMTWWKGSSLATSIARPLPAPMSRKV